MSSFKPLIETAVAALAVSMLAATPVRAEPPSEERPVSHFTELHVQQGIDVRLTQGSRESLRISAEGRELADVISKVDGSVLTLTTTGARRERQTIVADVEFVQLSAIVTSGGSEIQGRNALRLEDLAVKAAGGSDVDLEVEAKSLKFDIAGGSDLRLRGSTPSLAVTAVGGSDVSARDMVAERVRLDISGGCDATVQATAAIELKARGGSDVRVFGSPASKTQNTDRSSAVVWQ